MPDQGSMPQQRQLLIDLFYTAVKAAHPSHCLDPYWPALPENGRLIVIAAGKAAAAMLLAAERHYLPIDDSKISGFGVTRYGYGEGVSLSKLTLMEAGHPVPDVASAAAADKALALAGEAAENDIVLFLISGGASALLAAPADGLTLADKQALTRDLLRCGATISEINCVRKHLSRIKGGRLARAAFPATAITLAISDVPGDAPDAIGSGPTVADPTTLADALAVLTRYGVTPPPAIAAALSDPANETSKPGDAAFAKAKFVMAASPSQVLKVAADQAASRGYEVTILGDALEGEARRVATEHAALAKQKQSLGKPALILSGGELTVTVKGDGRGGPNQEYALALALALGGAPGIHALAADTDGTDGGSGAADDPAGAIISPTTLARAASIGRDAATFLENNNSTAFFESLGDLLVSGPTQTNVNDFRAILVEPVPGDS